MPRFRDEPLVHFCALGVLLFGAHRLVVSHSRHQIVLSPAFVQTQGDVDRFIDEEVLYREALALGLDRGDVIVRRRLVQKMELILRGVPAEPSQAQLEKFLAANSHRYDAPPRISFHHVFNVETLRPDEAWEKQGEPFVPGRKWTARSEKELAAIFGAAAAQQLMTLAPGVWTRVDSRFGKHLVFVDEKLPARQVSVEEVRGRLRDDWSVAERARLDREALAELRARYTVERR